MTNEDLSNLRPAVASVVRLALAAEAAKTADDLDSAVAAENLAQAIGLQVNGVQQQERHRFVTLLAIAAADFASAAFAADPSIHRERILDHLSFSHDDPPAASAADLQQQPDGRRPA